MRIANTPFYLDPTDNKVRITKGAGFQDTGLEAYVSPGAYSPNPGAVPARDGISLSMKQANRAADAIAAAYPATKGKLQIMAGDDVYGFNGEPVIPQVGALGHSSWWLVYRDQVAFHPLAMALAAAAKGVIDIDAELQSLGLLAELK